MISNKQLAKLIQDRLNGKDDNYPQFLDIYGLNNSESNLRYEFRLFANDGEYNEAENQAETITPDETNVITQFINGILITSGGNATDGISYDSINTAVEARIEFLIPNCDDKIVIEDEEFRLQDAVEMLINDALGLPSSDVLESETNTEIGKMSFFVAGRYSKATVSDRRHRTQVGMSVILSLFATFAIVAKGISSNDIVLETDGERIYFNRISISRTSTQENNVSATPDSYGGSPIVGVSKARTTATQLIIAFSAPVRPSKIYDALTEYLVRGTVEKINIKLHMPTNANGGEISEIYNMTIAEGGIAGEENLNAAYDIRLVEEMQ